jgi:hypothetical protein
MAVVATSPAWTRIPGRWTIDSTDIPTVRLAGERDEVRADRATLRPSIGWRARSSEGAATAVPCRS